MISKMLSMFNNGGSPYSPELQAVRNYANSMGYTLPSDAQLLNIDTRLIIPLKAAGFFTTHDCLYVLKNNGSAGFGGINLVDPFGSYSKVPARWVSNVGGGLLSTTYIPDGTRNYKINSVSVAGISVLITGANTEQISTSGTNSRVIADSNGSLSIINGIGYAVLGGVTGTVFHHASLIGTSLTLYVNTLSNVNTSGSPSLPINQWNVGYSLEASSQLAIAGIGGAMVNATIKTIYEDWFNNIP